jgi:chemotaxis protein histidine kinase CheA
VVVGRRITERKLENYVIKDFGPIRDLKIDFKDTPIVMLKGRNESGKSNASRALATLLYNTRQNSQKLLVNDNASGFRVEANFDGYQVVRQKTVDDKGKANSGEYQAVRQKAKVNSYEMSFSGEFLEEYKELGITDFYMSNIGVSSRPPEPVADILNMGFDEDTGEEYSYRRTNRMLLLTTLDSDNHKIVYNGLEASEIRSALKLAGEESKVLKGEYQKTAVIRAHTQREINDTYIPDITRLSKLHKDLKESELNYKELDRVLNLIYELVRNESKLELLTENLEPVSYSGFERLGLVICMIQELFRVDGKLKHLEGDLSGISIDNLSNLNSMVGKVVEIRGVLGKLKTMPDVQDIGQDDVGRVHLSKEVYSKISEYAGIAREIKKVEARLDEIQLTVKDLDGLYKECGNCGELVVLDGEG